MKRTYYVLATGELSCEPRIIVFWGNNRYGRTFFPNSPKQGICTWERKDGDRISKDQARKFLGRKFFDAIPKYVPVLKNEYEWVEATK